MKYFSMYTANSLPKNKLCDEFFAWLKGFDRALWNNGIECFEELFRAKIDELNAQNPRCTPLHFYRWEMGAFGTIGFSASIQDRNCSISFYKAEKEF